MTLNAGFLQILGFPPTFQKHASSWIGYIKEKLLLPEPPRRSLGGKIRFFINTALDLYQLSKLHYDRLL